MIRRHPILFYFGLSVLLSWAFWLPFAASQAGYLNLAIPAEFVWLGEFTPSLVALGLTFYLGGATRLRQLIANLLRWRVSFSWYFFVLLLTPSLVLLSLTIDSLLFGSTVDFSRLLSWDQRFVERTRAFTPSMGLISGIVQFMEGGLIPTAFAMILLSITNGGLSEEIGWRGFALPQLRQQGYGIVQASLLVGLMWAFWHTGTGFWKVVLSSSTREAFSFSTIYLFEYLLLVIPLSLIYSVVMYGTRGSILLAVLLHASYNLTISIAATAWPEFPMLTMLILLWVFAVGMTIQVLRWNRASISNGARISEDA